MDEYVYNEPTKADFVPLPDGDYPFVVSEAEPPYKSEGGNFVLPIVLLVGKDAKKVFDYPSAGTTKAGASYDSIAGFLKAIGKNPKPGERPNFSASNLIGSRGTCRIKTEIIKKGKLEGQPGNKVAFYVFEVSKSPRQSSSAPPPPARRRDPDLNAEPDDIPFLSRIGSEVKQWRGRRARVML